MITKTGRKEVAAVRSMANVQSIVFSMSVISKVSVFLALVSYILFDHMITVRKVFIISSYFGTLESFMLLYWPSMMSAW